MIRFYMSENKDLPYPRVGEKWIAIENRNSGSGQHYEKGDIIEITRNYEDFGDVVYAKMSGKEDEHVYVLTNMVPTSECYKCVYACKRGGKCELFEEG